MRILVLIAGTNDPSNSATLAASFAEGMRTVDGIAIETVLLKNLTIDHFSLRCYEPDFRPEEDFRTLQAKIEAADGLVFASPVWNFGIPGHFKNMIDRCGAFGLDAATRTSGQWKGKPFFLIFTGGAPMAAWTGLQKKTTSFVPTALKYFGGSHVGTHYEPRCMAGKGVFGLVVDKRPESLKAMREKGAAFAKLTKVYADTGKLPAKQSLMRGIYRLGQIIQKKFV